MRFTCWTACAALVATLAATPAAAQNEQTEYVVADTAGVTIRNIYDKAGIPVGKFGPGTVLAARETMGKWTQVEPASGLTCWVLGAYLNETETSGQYKVNGNGINMRPLPSTGNDSFPLMQHLYAGDMVRMVGRMDPSAPFKEDWVQIRTPKGVYGWALTSTLKPAPDPAQAATTWEAEWSAIMDAMGGSDETSTDETGTDETTTTPKLGTEDELVRARRMMNESPPKYDEAKKLFAAVLAKTPSSSPIARAAQNGMIQADAYMSIEALQRQLEAERVERERKETERQAELDRRLSKDTTLKGRYDARGWLEIREMRNGETAWYLRFAGQDTCTVQCTSGRYDLGMFAGYEVGVIGLMTNEAGWAQSNCDMRSIEVLSGRAQ